MAEADDEDARRGRPRTHVARMRIAGHAVRYETTGAGPPVILVHGLGGSARWWRTTTAALAGDHRVIVPELPGFGYGVGVPPFRLPDAIAVLRRLIERLRLERPALVGHSLGALVCLGVAAASPEAVGRLVLISPPVRTASPRMAGNVIPMVRTLMGLSPGAALTVMSDVATRAPDALVGAAEEILAHEGEPGIADEPPVPTLVVLGARDAVVPIEGAGWIAQSLPGARIVVIPGAGHVPMLDRPEALDAELRRFLAAS